MPLPNARAASVSVNGGLDLEATERFLGLLRATRCTFQTFDDDPARKDRKLASILHGSLAEHAATLQHLNGLGAGIFVAVNQTDCQGRKRENIKRVRAVTLDLDGEPLDPVKHCALKPHIIVESSPGRYHCYWRVKGLALYQFEDVQRAIAQRFDGDPEIAKLTHVARLPGFYHRKREPFCTHIVEINDLPAYSAEEIVEEFPPETKAHRPPISTAVKIGAGTLFHLADQASPGWRDDVGEPKNGKTKLTQSDLLIELAGDADLFHTDERIAFADIEVHGHVETWPIKSDGFRQWLRHRYFIKTNRAPNREAITSAIAALEARAQFDGPTYQIHLRIASYNGKIYLDLCDDQWRAVEIDEKGWHVVDTPPVRFTRARGMLPLPMPVRGGTVDVLRQFINIKKAGDFALLGAYVVAALRDRGPYPILALRGEEGTGKSTLVRIIRSLVDPNRVPLRPLPREERDLYITARNGHVLAFDNVSTLPPWLSDSLCRLATGGGFATRMLYTDQDEVLIDATRPSLLNGIEDFVARPDLADRCIFINLTPIADEERQDEAELNADFEAARPAILGALLDAVAHGLREWPSTRLKEKPRMADFARWATACEGAMFEQGSFEQAYRRNRNTATADVIEADMVADAIRSFMREREEWSGTASELRDMLEDVVGEKHAKSKTWPDTPRALRSRLQRAQAPLRKIGIVLTFDRSSRKHAIGIRTEADPNQTM